MMFTECDRFTEGSTNWKICRHESRLPTYKETAYRVRWGLAVVKDDDRTPPATVEQGSISVVSHGASIDETQFGLRYGAGNELIKIYEAAGMPHCDDCVQLAKQMNDWGVAACRQNINAIVSDILPRARDWVSENQPWAKSIPRLIGDVGLRAWIKGDVDRAINTATRIIESHADTSHNVRTFAANAAKGKQGRQCCGRGNRASRSGTIPAAPNPFTAPPKISLVFHCWPKLGGWERHVEKIKAIEHRFARKLMGISVGAPGCVSAEVVRETFGDSWEYFEFPNDRNLGEVPTLTWALSELPDGPNDVTFYCHSKGTKNATMNSDAVRWWTDAMYETVIHNVDAVVQQLNNGAVFAGSMQYKGRKFPSHNSWHFSGTYWAFRNSAVVRKCSDPLRKYYGTEAFPSDCVPASRVACMFGKVKYPSLYKEAQQPHKELEQWRVDQLGPLPQFEAKAAELTSPTVLLTGAKPWLNSVNPDRTHHVPHGVWTSTDIEDGDGVEIVADLEHLDTTTDRRFDCIFSPATLEHVKRPWEAIKAMARTLNPGGLLFIHSHQTFPLHGYPADHFRFSGAAMRTMCEDAGLIVAAVGYDCPCKIVPDPPVAVWNTEAPAYLNSDVFAMKPAKENE